MPPKRIAGEPRSKASKNIIATTYSALTSPENASVVGSVAMFGAAIAFLASPWSEYLLSP
ncbi:TOM core complex subunit Tom6 [Xylaria sp. CBS 124048]|nr:TOM core complex subunit Tom6 [Xylaria sp. CBS 124048]